MKTILAAVGLLLGVTALAAADWQATTWNGEPAFASESQGWRAVVSVTRARLIHFGPAGQEVNLLLAPPTCDPRQQPGGHRLWFGPQAEWPQIWPPPAAWEAEEPAAITVANGALRLEMAATGDAWPRLVRTYQWDGARLVCGAESSGGKRPAQFIQILQVPANTRVSVQVRPEASFPAGYVQLPSTAGPFAARFAPPPHVTLRGDTAVLHHTGEVVKLGFRPQTLTAEVGAYELQVSRGHQTGQTVGEPDEGFHTQVYLSNAGEAFAELEQLSPRFAPGHAARFEIVLSGRAR